MNFVSHYYCNISRPGIYKISCFLPDIFPKFSYQRNTTLKLFDTSVYSQEELLIWEGIQKHYTDDGVFHGLESFKSNVGFISNLMKEDNVLKDTKRKFMTAHVLYELILDNMLIDVVDNIIEDIYDDIERIDEDLIISFIQKTFNKKDTQELYISRFYKFQEEKFLYFYKKEENLVKALSKVLGKMGGFQFEEPYIGRFMEIIKKSKSQIDIRRSLV